MGREGIVGGSFRSCVRGRARRVFRIRKPNHGPHESILLIKEKNEGWGKGKV